MSDPGGTSGRTGAERRVPEGSPVTIAVPRKIRLVCATRWRRDEFFKASPLGRSLQFYQTYPRGQGIELRLAHANVEGLPVVYNRAIDEAANDPAILVFLHDDVYLNDFHWAHHVQDSLKSFDIVGLAGNKRRLPGQVSWMYPDLSFAPDDHVHLSGVIGHGEGFPDLVQLSAYGPPKQKVLLLDGVFIAARSETLVERSLRFDPRFSFHFYDMDFCRQAEARGLTMGTWPISMIHNSAGRLGTAEWQAAYRLYRDKYQDVMD